MTLKIEVYKNCNDTRFNAEIVDEWENEYGTKQKRFLTYHQDASKEKLYERIKKEKEEVNGYYDELLKKIEKEL